MFAFAKVVAIRYSKIKKETELLFLTTQKRFFIPKF